MKSKPFSMGLKPTPLFLPVVLMLTIVLFALSGCGATPVADDDFKPTPVTFNIKVPYKCGQPPAVSAVIMRDVEFESFEVDGVDYFALTVDDYKAFGLNISDWIAASDESKKQRHFYRDCITRSQKETHDENLDTGLVPSVRTGGSK